MIDRRRLMGSGLAAAAVATLPKAAFGHVITPPYKLFDTHAHFYTNDVDKYPFKATRSRYGPEVMVAKAMRYPNTPKEVFAFWDECGIAKGCGVQYNSTYQNDNSYLLDVAAQYPERIIPIVITDPISADGPALLRKFTAQNRIAGVRWTSTPDKAGEFVFLADAAAASWEAANALGLVVVLMPIGGSAPHAMARVAEFAVKYPNTRIVLDHIGFPQPDKLPQTQGLSPEHIALAKIPNVYYKYTTLLIEQYLGQKVDLRKFLERMVATFGADKMVWGSDTGNSPGTMFKWVQYALDSASGLSMPQQKALFFDTANRIFVPGGRPA